MDVVIECWVEILFHPGFCLNGFFTVKGLYHFIAEAEDFAAFDQWLRDRLAGVGIGQAHDRGHRGDGFDDLWLGYHDAGACAGEAEL